MTTFAQLDTSTGNGLVIPETPDLARLRRETGARLRSAMADRSIDAMILLGNNAVVYATGASWPLGDAGLSYVERPVAVVQTFMAHHVVVLGVYFPGHFWTLAVPFSLGIAVGGVVWAWLYERTDSVWSPWLSHALVDAAIFVIGWDLVQRGGGL